MGSGYGERKGNLAAARRFLSEIQSKNIDEEFFLQYEVDARILETAIALKSNDLKHAEALAERNIKWLQTRRYSLSQGPTPYFFRVVSAIVSYRLTGTAPRPSVRKHFEEYQASARMYAMLIEEDVAEMFEAK